MAISVDVEVREFSMGAAGRLGDPLGVWSGSANVTGDASGDPVLIVFTADQDNIRRFLYVVDSVTMNGGSSIDVGNLRVDVTSHNRSGDQTLDTRRSIVVNTLDSNAFTAQEVPPAWLRAFPVWWEKDFGGSAVERSILAMVQEVNSLAFVYSFRCAGRYYDARIISSRDFWRVIPADLWIP